MVPSLTQIMGLNEVKEAFYTILDNLNIPDFDYKIMFYQTYFPLKQVFFHAKFHENHIYFSDLFFTLRVIYTGYSRNAMCTLN
jgi:hypothetical protein